MIDISDETQLKNNLKFIADEGLPIYVAYYCKSHLNLFQAMDRMAEDETRLAQYEIRLEDILSAEFGFALKWEDRMDYKKHLMFTHAVDKEYYFILVNYHTLILEARGRFLKRIIEQI